MATRKPRSPKPRDPIPKYTLDGTGAHDAPTMTEILTKGAPEEVREFLSGQGALMRAGAPLPAPMAEWLGAVLEAIGNGADANKALRVKKATRGPQAMGVRERAVIEHQIAGLIGQGVPPDDAYGIVERYRMALRHSDDPDALHGRTEEEHSAASARMKKRLQRRRQQTK
jgi:hypothetical protein